MKRDAGLWDSADCKGWHDAGDLYPAIIQAASVKRLEELDHWYHAELPTTIKERSPAYVTLDELARVTAWKMRRGVWRERNRLLVESNDPDVVRQTTEEAFAAVPDPRKPVAIISRLAGVGPATASAVLAAHSPGIYPFFDELVAAQMPGLGPVAFTAAYYARYAAMLREKADEVSGLCPHHRWTAQDLSQALWAASGGK